MRVLPTELGPAAILESDVAEDERGCFFRTFCAETFERFGLPQTWVQQSISKTRHQGTLRGMHFQIAPSRESKLVRCMEGRVLDVIIDLRPDAATFLQHLEVVLDGSEPRALYVPAGFAHGFLTLTADVVVLYQMTDVYEPKLSRGVRWDDPVFNISWPGDAPIMNERDAAYPDFDDSLVQGFRGY